MFEGPEELIRKISLGEDTSLQFKSVRFRGDRVSAPGRDALADELAALGNTRAGTLVLGVDDETRDVTGIPVDRLDAVERYVFEICNESITPPLHFHSFRLELPDALGDLQPVLQIKFPRSLFVHRNPGGYFFRQGSSKREMPPDYLARQFQQRSQLRLIRFEEQSTPHSSKGDLSKRLRANYTGRSGESAEVLLLKRGLLAKDDRGSVRASVAGVLLCCEEPERFLPNAYVEAVRYRGKKQDSNYQVDAQRICGPLSRQIERSMVFLRKNQTVSTVKTPHRFEVKQFSERAVFEAVVNAVAHRDYSIYSSKIHVFMFDDRLEIYSPGALPNTVTIDNISLRQSNRNELIATLLAETPVPESVGDVGRSFYMEKRGEGVPIILDRSQRLSGKKPVYRLIEDSELLLTIFSASMRRTSG